MRAVGFNPEAARYGGMSVGTQLPAASWRCAALFAGLAGVDGRARLAVPDRDERHPDLADRLPRASRSRCSGATRRSGRCSAALLFGALLSGTSQRNLDPTIFEPELASNLTTIIQGLVVLFVSADVLVLGDPARADGGLVASAPTHGGRRSGGVSRERRRDGRRPARACRARTVGVGAAIALGVVACVHHAAAARWSAPPVPSLVLGARGASRPARGRSRGGEQRLGWGAIVAGVVGARRRDRRDAVGRRQPRDACSSGRRWSRPCCATRRR